MNRINVTCAIILRGGCFLACKRGAESDHPFEWEFPGGKIETGESEEECIFREISEELNVRFTSVRRLNAVDYDYPKKSICLIPFLGTIGNEDPSPTEHVQIYWLPIDEFETLKWSEADELLFRKNLIDIKCGLT